MRPGERSRLLRDAAAAGGRGRFWAGPMELSGRGPVGALHVLHPDGAVMTALTGPSVAFDGEDLREPPHAGGVFRYRPGVAGRASHLAAV